MNENAICSIYVLPTKLSDVVKRLVKLAMRHFIYLSLQETCPSTFRALVNGFVYRCMNVALSIKNLY